ncbi:MAG: ABC transporter ATP-binding protein [Spirochaetales bacterium]|nr:ABC transporter ATP-binding protein [Spirochaetales bacterium]
MSGVILNVNNLNRSFGGLHAVDDVTLSVEEGLIKSIIGPNGAGKTTFFNLISGNIRPDSGHIHFYGKDITGLKPFQVAALGICRTFQNTRLFGHMTVMENIMVGRHLKSRSGFISSLLGLPGNIREEKSIRASVLSLLEELNLSGIKDELCINIPFGLQRKVEIARALAVEPELLMLDEPAAGLNIYETTELGQLIGKIRDRGVTVLLVEHDISLVMNISDEIMVLNQGKKLAEGKPKEIQKNEEVIKVYLGE